MPSVFGRPKNRTKPYSEDLGQGRRAGPGRPRRPGRRRDAPPRRSPRRRSAERPSRWSRAPACRVGPSDPTGASAAHCPSHPAQRSCARSDSRMCGWSARTRAKHVSRTACAVGSYATDEDSGAAHRSHATATWPTTTAAVRLAIRKPGRGGPSLSDEKTPLVSSHRLVRADRRRRVALVRARARLARAA